MLTRIISAAFGIAFMVMVLILHKTIMLPAAVAAIVAVMLFELLRTVKLHKCLPILIAVEFCGISVPLVSELWYRLYFEGGEKDFFNVFGFEPQNTLIFEISLAAAFIVFIVWLKKHKEIRYEQVFFALASMILVPQAMTTMLHIERRSGEHGVFFLIMGLCGAWIADSGAYFTGVAIGKHKLCPEISPKKTIEGFVGGIISTGIVFAGAFAVYNYFIAESRIETYHIISFIIAGMICAVIGTVGDLSASMIKRQTGIKDYGKIMPGHGGLMDRFDSVLFVLPTFYAFLSLAGII